ELIRGLVVPEDPDRGLHLVEGLEDASGVDHGSAFDAQETGTRTRANERLGLVTRDPDPAARVLLLRLTPHELCDRLAGQAARVAELADDVLPRSHVDLAVGRTDAVEAGARIRPAPAGEQLELGRLERPVLQLAEQLVERVRLDLELLEPRLPRYELRVAGLDAAQRTLQLDEAPERDGVPMLGRRHALEGLERALPIAAVVEQVPEIDACLVVIRIDLEGTAEIATRARFVAEAVQRVAERGDRLGAVRPQRGGVQEDLARLGVEPLAVERAPHRQERIQVVAAARPARPIEQGERFLAAPQPEHDLAQPHEIGRAHV